MSRPIVLLSVLGFCALGLAAVRPGLEEGGPTVSHAVDADGMTIERLGSLLVDEFGEAHVDAKRPGTWVVTLQVRDAEQNDNREAAEADEDPESAADEAEEAPVLLIMTDQRANRMRVMAPVMEINLQEEDDLKLVLMAMHANYDRALDARYALHNGVLWSAFIHPLSSLTEDDLKSGLSQVKTLRENTGTSFSSGGLLFAPGVGEAVQPEPSRKSEPTI